MDKGIDNFKKNFLKGKENLVKSSKFNLDLGKPMLQHINYPDQSQEFQNSIVENKKREKLEDLEYRNSVLSALQGIEKNTAVLTEITLLLSKNNEKQEETFELLVEILGVLKSSSKEEAVSKYRAVVEKIQNFTDDYNTYLTLQGIANTVINAYEALPFLK